MHVRVPRAGEWGQGGAAAGQARASVRVQPCARVRVGQKEACQTVSYPLSPCACGERVRVCAPHLSAQIGVAAADQTCCASAATPSVHVRVHARVRVRAHSWEDASRRRHARPRRVRVRTPAPLHLARHVIGHVLGVAAQWPWTIEGAWVGWLCWAASAACSHSHQSSPR